MKNTCKLYKSVFVILLIMTGVFFVACGLEEIITVEPPNFYNNRPDYSSSDFTTMYFDFTTNESKNDSLGSAFKGTNVYYKIYNNSDDLDTQRNAIENLSASSSSSSTAFDKLTGSTSSSCYGYQLLSFHYFKTEDSKPVNLNETITVDQKGTDQRIYIRLKDAPNSASKRFNGGYAIPYSGENKDSTLGGAVINFLCYNTASSSIGKYYWLEKDDKWYDSSYNEISASDLIIVQPARVNNCSFDIFNEEETDYTDFKKLPVSGDEDFCYNSTSTEEYTYYVQLFAVGVVWDSTNLSYSYSTPFNLGSVQIKKGQL